MAGRSGGGQLPARSPRPLPVGRGYARVPEQLLHDRGVSDLGVLVWVQLVLDFDGRWGDVGYADFAGGLGLDGLSLNAIEKRFGAAMTGLVDGGWVERHRMEAGSNAWRYRALQVPTPGSGRYAQLRRDDLVQLRDGSTRPKTVADFARWQLECGEAGWTARPADTIAQRWGITERALRTRRAAVVGAGLLVVEARSGASDLVWLSEVYEPGWNILDEGSEPASTPEEYGGSTPLGTPEENGGSVRKKLAGRPRKKMAGPNKEDLAAVGLTSDLSALGAVSAAPLSQVTREPGDAPPQAASTPENPLEQPPDSPGDAWQTACDLLAGQDRLRRADSWWRRKALRLLADAIGNGVEPAHLEANLELQFEDPAVPHVTAVRQAVAQARADTLAGTCPDCRGPGGEMAAGHTIGCPQRATMTDDLSEAAVDSMALESLQSTGTPEPAGCTDTPTSAPPATAHPKAAPRSGPDLIWACTPQVAGDVEVTDWADPSQVYEWSLRILATAIAPVEPDLRRQQLATERRKLRCRRELAAHTDTLAQVTAHLQWLIAETPTSTAGGAVNGSDQEAAA